MSKLDPKDVLADLFESYEFQASHAPTMAAMTLQRLRDAGFRVVNEKDVKSRWQMFPTSYTCKP